MEEMEMQEVGPMERKIVIEPEPSEDEMQNVYLRIFTNYMQFTGISVSFDLKWPASTDGFFSVFSAVGSSYKSFVSFDCFLADSNYLQFSDILFYKACLIAVLPLIVIFVFFVFWGIYKWKTGAKKVFRVNFVVSVIVALFMLHPNITDTVFALFICKELDSNKFYLKSDYDK
jgi:hypothetical protein